MCSVQVQPLAGPIKWNRPGVTIWSVLQNPVTFEEGPVFPTAFLLHE